MWSHQAFGSQGTGNHDRIGHAWIHLEHTNDTGVKESWMVEGRTPNTLLRNGLNRKSLMPGTIIVVDGYQSKDRSQPGNGRDGTFAHGCEIFMGSSGTGAPRDGKDPAERAK